MLTIQPTEMLAGFRISGDYWDIDSLLTAIYEVTGDENRYFDFKVPETVFCMYVWSSVMRLKGSAI